MKLVVDANVLIAELRRQRGQWLLQHTTPIFLIAQPALEEARHELERRLTMLQARGQMTADQAGTLRLGLDHLVTGRLAVVPAARYAPMEAVARARVPRDPQDWPSVAVALVEAAAIWTEDQDFFGCGVATWRTEILLNHLRGDASMA